MCVTFIKKPRAGSIAGNSFYNTEIEVGKKGVIPYEEKYEQVGYSEYIAIRINEPYESVDSFTLGVYFSGFTGVKILE